MAVGFQSECAEYLSKYKIQYSMFTIPILHNKPVFSVKIYIHRQINLHQWSIRGLTLQNKKR